MKNKILLALAIVVAVLTGGNLAKGVFVSTTPEDPSNPIAIRGCVIRFDTKNAAGTAVVPRIYEDNVTHRCVGVSSVGLESNGDLRINNTGGVNEVITVWAQPDETLSATFRQCGVSGGGVVSIVRCYKEDGTRVRFNSIDDVYGPGSNIWFGGFVWDD